MFNVNNPPKLYGIALFMVLASVGLFIGRLDATQWLASIGPFAGYLVGNGVAARKGDPIEPAISRKPEVAE